MNDDRRGIDPIVALWLCVVAYGLGLFVMSLMKADDGLDPRQRRRQRVMVVYVNSAKEREAEASPFPVEPDTAD